MGLDVGGNTIAQASGTLTINTGVPMMLRSTGPVVRPNQVQFIAMGNQAGGWVYWSTEAQWNKVPFPTATMNINACFDIVNARFTAPVNGQYFLQACCGHLLKDLVSNGYYWHPVFAVNGGMAGGAVNTSYPNYRIRGYGQPIATYATSHIQEVYALNAGDYVEHFVYSTGGWNGTNGNRYYQPYTRFTGFLLG